jgi:HEAT repeat protein
MTERARTWIRRGVTALLLLLILLPAGFFGLRATYNHWIDELRREIREGVARMGELAERVKADPADAASLAELIRVAEDPNGNGIIRSNAVAYLGELGRGDPEPFWRAMARPRDRGEPGSTHAEALAPDVVPVLTRLLFDQDRGIRSGAAQGLGAFGRHAAIAVPALAAVAMRTEDHYIGQFAARSLGEIGLIPEVAVPALTEHLEIEKRLVGPWSPAYGVKALRSFGPAAVPAVPALVDLLGHSERSYAAEAARALAAIDPDHPALVPALRRLYGELPDDDRWLVLEAIRELGAHDGAEREWPPELVELVVGALAGPDRSEAANAARALAAIDPDHPSLVPALLHLYEEGPRYDVLLAISELGDRVWPPEVLELARRSASTAERDGEVRWLARTLLAEHPGVE